MTQQPLTLTQLKEQGAEIPTPKGQQFSPDHLPDMVSSHSENPRPIPLAQEIILLQEKLRSKESEIQQITDYAHKQKAKAECKSMFGWKNSLVEILSSHEQAHGKLVEQLNIALNKINQRVKGVDEKVSDSNRAGELEIEIASLTAINNELGENLEASNKHLDDVRGEIKRYKTFFIQLRENNSLINIKEAWKAATSGTDPEAIERLDALVAELDQMLK